MDARSNLECLWFRKLHFSPLLLFPLQSNTHGALFAQVLVTRRMEVRSFTGLEECSNLLCVLQFCSCFVAFYCLDTTSEILIIINVSIHDHISTSIHESLVACHGKLSQLGHQ